MSIKQSGVRYFLLGSLTLMLLLAGCGNKVSEQEGVNDSVPEETEDQTDTETSKIIYEGRYFDEEWYQYVDMPEEESLLVYCEILISNVTEEAFDFTINEIVMATGEMTPVISEGTATIEEKGTTAVYEEDNQTLTFTFPDDADTFPQRLEISGFDKLEGNVYINNSIPGHESG